MNDFVGSAQRLTRFDVENAAAKLKCEEAALRAVLAVESRGDGFDARKRPIILFEPHVFYRNLSPEKQEQAVAAGLAYRKWKTRPYPKGQDAQYARLARAIAIDEEAAYRSISVGMGQILGENFRLVGRLSAKDMFSQAKDGEAKQLDQMVNFIISKRIADDLRARRWRNFAYYYNGPGQVDKYAAWLEREYVKWVRILAKPRDKLTAQDLKAAGSKTIAGTQKAKQGLATAGAATGGAGAVFDEISKKVEPINKTIEIAKQTKDSWSWIADNWQWFALAALVVIAAIGVWWIWAGIQQAERERVLNAQDGINTRI